MMIFAERESGYWCEAGYEAHNQYPVSRDIGKIGKPVAVESFTNAGGSHDGFELVLPKLCFPRGGSKDPHRIGCSNK